LAINFAQLGQKVLLIDADMRKGWMHTLLKVPNDSGLSSFLSEDLDSAMLVRETTVPNLGLITAGPVPPDPVELLMGPRLGLLLDEAEAMGYEQIVIDGPPLLGIADAIVLGNQVQNIVLAVRAGSTRKDSMKDALRRLRTAGLVPMGVVLTHARDEHMHDRAYADYYGHGYAPGPAYTPRRAVRPAPDPVPLTNKARIEPTMGPHSA
jgi:polysaccharide biosynthesis transport protein